MATNLFRYQSAPAATTPTEIYTVPADKSAVLSNIAVCNRSSSPASFRIAIRAAGAALSDEHYWYKDCQLPSNTTFSAVVGKVMLAADVMEVYASSANLTFHVDGEEIG